MLLRKTLIRLGAIALVFSLQAMPSAGQCSVDLVNVPSSSPRTTANDLNLFMEGVCGSGQPELAFLRKNGATTQVFLNAPGGTIPIPESWAQFVELGRLPAGENTVEVYFANVASTPVLAASTTFEVEGPGCRIGRQAGATLLYPFLEVDLDDPGALTTLVSVANASTQPVLARAVLWSDWSAPLLAFDLYLEGNAVVPINLRDVLVEGRLPETGANLSIDSFSDCTAPLTLPSLSAAELATLRSRITGQADPGTGLCFSSDRGDTSRAVGFLTVDVLNRCSNEITYPIDIGYFTPGGGGVGSNLNALWGDFVLVDPSNDSAAGFEALAIAADATRDTSDGQLFGSRFYPGQGSDRPPLGSTHQSRFLRGGAFDGGTELLVWIDGFGKVNRGGFTCGVNPLASSFLSYRAAGESGGLPPATTLEELPACVLRLGIDDPALAIEQTAGLIEVETFFFADFPGVPHAGGVPSVVLSTLSAEGRFSVGYSSTPVGELCR